MTDKQPCLRVLRILLKNTDDWSKHAYSVSHNPSGLALEYKGNSRPFTVHVIANHVEKWTLGIWHSIPLQWGIFKLKRQWRINARTKTRQAEVPNSVKKLCHLNWPKEKKSAILKVQ